MNLMNKIRHYEEDIGEEQLEIANKKLWWLKLLIAIGLAFLNGFVIMYGYNSIIPELFETTKITIFQAMMIDILLTFIVRVYIHKEEFEEESIIFYFIRMSMYILYAISILIFMFILNLFI